VAVSPQPGWERRNSQTLSGAGIHADPKASPLVRQKYPEAIEIFRDAYTVEFLDLLPVHAEADRHRGLLEKLKDLLIGFGRDICSIGSEYPLQD